MIPYTFVWVKNTLELKILIHILEKKFNINCKSQKKRQVNHAQWFKINERDQKLEMKNYWDPPSTSSNTLTIKQINRLKK